MRHSDELSGIVLDTALRLHRDLGPGLLESAYQLLLSRRLEQMGLVVEQQKTVSAEFETVFIEAAFRADILIENSLLVEIKSIDRLAPVHSKQLLTYLRLLKQPVGLLLNFGGATLKEGVKRVVNDYNPSASPLSSPRLRVNQDLEGA